MGCFLACLGSTKQKRRKPRRLQRDRIHGCYESLQPISPLKQSWVETAKDRHQESRDKTQHQSFNSRKKVTFDLNVETYAQVLIHEEPTNSSPTDKAKDENEEEKSRNGNKRQFCSEDNSYATSLSNSCFPSNHRYQNCIYSSDEEDEDGEEEVEYENSDFEDDDSEGEEESFEAYFSRKTTAESTHFQSSSTKRQSTDIFKGNFRDRSQYIHSVLNPVENLTQWRDVKAKNAGPLKNEQKENAKMELELEPTFKLPKPQMPLDTKVSFNAPKPPNQDISVNASLSSWLFPSATMVPAQVSMNQTEFSERNKSSSSHEDRPILGAVTVEELKKSAASSGTAGNFSHQRNQDSESRGILNEISKYREVSMVN